MYRPPAEPGMPIDEIDTPALILDLDAFEANLDHMASAAKAAGVRVRPHAKTHKSPVVAHLQMARGAVGQCVQKVAEAEILAWGGVPDILVSNEVVSPAKLARLAALARIARVALCADHALGVDAIEAAAQDAGVRLPVLVEIDVGAARCGLVPGPEVLALARRIASSRHLSFGGLQAYQGRAQHQRTLDERTASIASAAEMTGRMVEDLRTIGLDCPIVGGAGTGTFALEAATGVFNELQVGSYVFMDADYGRNHPAPPFRQSLFVLSTVMSTPNAEVAVVDAGLKALAVDSGLPLVWQREGVTYAGASDEHGKLTLAPGSSPLKLDERVMLVPGHCDPTVDRYDWYVGVRNGRVECLWPISARGAMN
ncbi:DSD1 family PLP-dependent enzyme [Labrys monachus]|uniref:D-serine deaminase-like pyridoxal phosphate-dependent protein n=1 Tax=Labrys monachus TaxID=217067 RepID=A0ABU0FFT4_9HYPH|nr:DSD1 family PLP-dependent enzyme [Labrys monachus]MDQ0392910.1 D-serine deaminase-like pyridoxal phosphate-dependent protein [Labrys monachus]